MVLAGVPAEVPAAARKELLEEVPVAMLTYGGAGGGRD